MKGTAAPPLVSAVFKLNIIAYDTDNISFLENLVFSGL